MFLKNNNKTESVVLKNRKKTLVAPGEVIYLSTNDYDLSIPNLGGFEEIDHITANEIITNTRAEVAPVAEVVAKTPELIAESVVEIIDVSSELNTEPVVETVVETVLETVVEPVVEVAAKPAKSGKKGK
jgi:hypothetical protein